ncbi:ring canal kelch [Biomphalaria pfeifferi]|uniref:Ring canal kelch n=1 Tax=Biomphalaria pfeifferi TaxID=112525 RepID=A0AAD8BV40_BIOPF|nr:ring canal kelch [Biomphalaria pfeifferi]
MAMSDQIAKAVVKGIQAQMERCPFHDVIVTVEGREFKCHRLMLSATSDYFQAMFQSGMKEDLERKVEVKGISAEVFQLIIESVYYARDILTIDNVSNVWHAANQLQIDYLLQACEMIQLKRLSKDSSVDIYINAKLLNSKQLMDQSWSVIIQEFDYLRKLEDILYLDFEDMKNLVSDDNLWVPSEDVVVETILDWVNLRQSELSLEYSEFREKGKKEKDETSNSTKQAEQGTLVASRKHKKKKKEKADQVAKATSETELKKDVDSSSVKEKEAYCRTSKKFFLAELLAASKLFLVSGVCLQNLIENKLVLNDQKAFGLVQESLRYHLQPARRQGYCPAYGIHRNASLYQNVILTLSKGEPMQFSCRASNGQWFSLTNVTPTDSGRAVSYENDIYWTHDSCSQFASRYNAYTNTWSPVANLLVAREKHALVWLDHYLYAIGGLDCDSIERFNVEEEKKAPGSGQWENYGSLVIPMKNLTATTCGNLIVVFGSESDESTTTMVQIFNTQTITANIVMDSMSGAAKNITSFSQGKDTFVLQESGALWKVSVGCNKLLNIEFQSMLWGDPFILQAAIVFNQQLLVFGDGVDPQMPREWDVMSFEHFQRIKIIERQGYFFLNSVLLKTFLVTPED